MSNPDLSGAGSFDEESFVLRHKNEALNMFEHLDHLLKTRCSFDLSLDIGGGYGDHLPFLFDRVVSVFSVDVIDYLSDPAFCPRAVQSRSEKYGGKLNLEAVSFHRCDARKLFYRDEMFDFVFSLNAFEHIPNPVPALSEALRVARKGAPIYLQFDPIWNSPAGHHLPHLGFEPWAHLLLNKSEFCREIIVRGGNGADVSVFEGAMNKRPFSFYKKLFFEDFADFFQVLSFATWSTSPEEEAATMHPNFMRCLALGYSQEELITRGVQFVGLKI